MKKTALLVLIAGVALSDVAGQAWIPNYLETTVYQNVNDGTTALVSKSYSDGLGKSIETKAVYNVYPIYNNNVIKSIVNSTIYDIVGRPNAKFLPLPSLTFDFEDYTQLHLSASGYVYGKYPGQTNYLYRTAYYDDPLSRIKETSAAGDEHFPGGHTTLLWYFGTGIDVESDRLDENGFVNALTLKANAGSRLSLTNFLNGLPKNLIAFPAFFLTITMDENDSITQTIKNVFGQTVGVWSCVDNYSHPVIAKYDFDILGNKITETPPATTVAGRQPLQPTSYHYNTLGQLTEKTLPDLGNGIVKEKYQYDDAGRMIKVTRVVNNADFESISITYDNLGRVRAKTKSPTGPCPVPEVSYFYDGAALMFSDTWKEFYYSNLLACQMTTEEQTALLDDLYHDDNAKGRLTSVFAVNKIPTSDNPSNKYSVGDFYVYDDEGRIKNRYKSVPGVPLQKFAYSYNLKGDIVSDVITTLYSKRTRLYDYDANGRLFQIRDGGINDNNSSTKLVSYDYDETGRLTKKHFHQKTSAGSPDEANYDVRYSYNIRDWVRSIQAGTFGNGDFFGENLKYSMWDNPPNTDNFNPQYNGNISQVDYQYGNNGLFTLDYKYDAINRLVQTQPLEDAAQIHKEIFSYNEDGRFNSKWVGKYTAPSSPREYEYYGSTSRLKRLSTQDGSGNYLYDYYGNMVYDASKKMAVMYDWRNLPVKFSFYTIAPNIGQYTNELHNGIVSQSDLGTIFNGMTPVSEVFMAYDADGNRVIKLEKK
jgi:hypothetical protein